MCAHAHTHRTHINSLLVGAYNIFTLKNVSESKNTTNLNMFIENANISRFKIHQISLKCENISYIIV